MKVTLGFKKKSLILIGFETNDLDIFKVHIMAEKVNMACNFRILIKTCHFLSVLYNSGL